MDFNLDDFTLFNEPQYQKYKQLRGETYHKDIYGVSIWILCYLTGCYFVYRLFGVDIAALFFFYAWLIFGPLTEESGLQDLYYKVFHFFLSKTASYKMTERFKKRYLPQEELIRGKIRSLLNGHTASYERAHIVASNVEYLKYLEKAQEKIGSTYPVLSSDIEEAKKLIADGYDGNQIINPGKIYRSSKSTSLTKKKSSPKSISQTKSSSVSNNTASKLRISQLI